MSALVRGRCRQQGKRLSMSNAFRGEHILLMAEILSDRFQPTHELGSRQPYALVCTEHYKGLLSVATKRNYLMSVEP